MLTMRRRIAAGCIAAWMAAGCGLVQAAGPTVNLREVFEAMGSQVTWDAGARAITVKRGSNTIRFQEDSATAVKNGVAVTMDTPIRITDTSGKAQISVYAVYPLAKDNRKERHYRVQAGDSLWKISKLYGTTIDNLRTWNQLKSDTLWVGQHLTTVDPYYSVVSGDTLYKIATRTESTVTAIRSANDLKTDMLQIGQKLYIPPAAAIDPPPSFKDAVFPLVDKTYDSFEDTYGDGRAFTVDANSRIHEGNDVTAKTWVPVFSVYDGTVVRKGWITYGGWRLSVQTSNGIAFYYAHMAGYADGIALGSKVKKGQLIGYVGSTGYGPEGTTGKFVPHLHFGMYDTNQNWKPMNPYTYLRWWEQL